MIIHGISTLFKMRAICATGSVRKGYEAAGECYSAFWIGYYCVQIGLFIDPWYQKYVDSNKSIKTDTYVCLFAKYFNQFWIKDAFYGVFAKSHFDLHHVRSRCGFYLFCECFPVVQVVFMLLSIYFETPISHVFVIRNPFSHIFLPVYFTLACRCSLIIHQFLGYYPAP